MRVIRGRTFGAERVQVDGITFIDCRFVGSTLVFSGGPIPTFDRTELAGAGFDFEGAAYETIKFLRFLKLSGGAAVVDGFLTMRRDKIN